MQSVRLYRRSFYVCIVRPRKVVRGWNCHRLRLQIYIVGCSIGGFLLSWGARAPLLPARVPPPSLRGSIAPPSLPAAGAPTLARPFSPHILAPRPARAWESRVAPFRGVSCRSGCVLGCALPPRGSSPTLLSLALRLCRAVSPRAVCTRSSPLARFHFVTFCPFLLAICKFSAIFAHTFGMCSARCRHLSPFVIYYGYFA